MNSNRWFVIVNPSSGNGAGKKLWSRIFERLKCENINFEFRFTEFHKHSVKLTHNAINQGFRRVLIVGGDGTFHNVVNGVMKQKVCPSYRITLGIIPIGTGNDWVKTYKIPMKIDKAIDLLLKGRVKQQDVGKITLNDKNKTEVFFNNLAGVGFDGHVVNRVNRYKKHGAMAYMIGAIAGLFSYKNFLAEVNIGAEKIKTKSLMILVGICQYSGGGMQLTNTPSPNDGLFDVSLAKDLTKWQIIKNLGNLYSGKIVKHKLVETFKTTNLEVLDVANSLPIIQADGELIGKGTFQVKIIPKAISFFC